ncbi:MAG: Tetratricopeptide repeat protein, partial [Euryarchaeota archaeon]|nr:Tetratricopeptide repeat protein [Euryarchaeota archaeon]
MAPCVALVCLLLILPVASAAQNDSAAYWLAEGNLALSSENFPDAVDSFDRALKIDPENASAWGGKGSALASQGRYKMAELCLGYALRIDDGNAGLWLEDGRAKELSGEWSDALKSYRKAIALQNTLAYAWLGRANASFALKYYEEARYSFMNASRYGLFAAGNAGQIEVLLAQGKELLTAGSYTGAYNISSQALDLDSQNIGALQLKADALTDLGRIEDAISCYDQILSGNATQMQAKEGKSRALVLMGDSELATGNVSRALLYFEEASRLAPQNEEAVIGLVKALTARGDRLLAEDSFALAKKSYETALVLSPLDPAALAGLEKASTELTAEAELQESKNTTIQRDLKSSDSTRYLQMAQGFYRNGSLPLALESINESLEEDSSLAEAWALKGQILSASGSNSEALESLDQALQLNRSSLFALALKGRVLSTMGKYRMAGLFFDSAL